MKIARLRDNWWKSSMLQVGKDGKCTWNAKMLFWCCSFCCSFIRGWDAIPTVGPIDPTNRRPTSQNRPCHTNCMYLPFVSPSTVHCTLYRYFATTQSIQTHTAIQIHAHTKWPDEWKMWIIFYFMLVLILIWEERAVKSKVDFRRVM